MVLKDLYFQALVPPPWFNCISELNNTEKNINFDNVSSSYILLKQTNNSIYAITGGYGHNYIKEDIEKGFGLNLIPKLVESQDSIVKRVVEDRLTGNRISDSRINRYSTTLDNESNFASIYKELEIEIGNATLSELGVELEKGEIEKDKSIRINNKDSICIKRSLSIKELTNTLNSLDKIYKKDMNFSLNAFKPVKSEDYKNSEILGSIIDKMIEEDYDSFNFEIIGENVVKYHNNIKFCFSLEKRNFKFEPESIITWDNLLSELKNQNFKKNKTSLNELFKKGRIITYDESGKNTLNSSLINCLSGFYTWDEKDKTFYLLNGRWYIIDNKYEEIFNENFKKIYECSKTQTDEIIKKFPSLKENRLKIKENVTECDYNEEFKYEKDIIYAHTIYPDNSKKIEIADLIFYDKEDKILYLLCAKKDFNAGGCRDLYGQIEISADYIEKFFINRVESKIETYYTNLDNKRKEKCDHSELPMQKEEFKKYFNGKICYIALFVNRINENTNSLFSKIMTTNIKKFVNEKGFKFILMDLNFEEDGKY